MMQPGSYSYVVTIQFVSFIGQASSLPMTERGIHEIRPRESPTRHQLETQLIDQVVDKWRHVWNGVDSRLTELPPVVLALSIEPN